MTARAIGILGGTFDPVHVGHLAVGEVARTTLDLESVLFMPAGQPPHKLDQPITDARHREAMLRLAIADCPGFAVSRIELERPGPSYSVDTLERVTAESDAGGRPDPWLILSSEALRGFPTWRDPDRILALARIAVAPRPGSEPADRGWLEARFPGRSDRFAFLPGPHLTVSATENPAARRPGADHRWSRAAGGRAVHHGAPSLPGGGRAAPEPRGAAVDR